METEEGLRAAEAAAEEVRSEKASQGAVVAPVVSPPPVAVPEKKKRGRPRKYGPDGSLLLPLNPTPISTSAPAGGDFGKRGRGRPLDFAKKSQHGFELEPLGEMVTCSAGANFTPHVISVAAGEDVNMKIISFSQQGPRAICILSANGVISNVTLRQPDSSGGTLTYEGRFELLSLSGSFMPTDDGGTRSRHGGISVSLASPDGRVVGGSLAGLLVAAGPVQVVVGSFIPGYQMEQKSKKPRHEPASVTPLTTARPISIMETEEAHGAKQEEQRSSVTAKPTVGASSSFRAENWTPSLNSMPDNRNSSTDINISLPSS
ncbi:AF0104/ALDC/Ptd012-like protein [Dioscorea alata]|uniref:AF0104/ALDC/Ptd012-like protein n=1 Tax=Dioscorea alata TaxID=55571 RepID=A0ACB7WH67_DIOAL|nr:AF0104/ALDC/Ptd012-like protein [Dioscorea alata]